MKLNGTEIRFLRKSMGLKSLQLAEKLAVSPEHLSRFENNKQPITEVYEKLLRAAVCLHHLDDARGLSVDVKKVLSMKIVSAVCSENAVVQELFLSDTDETQNLTPGIEAPDTQSKWHDGDYQKIAV